MYNKEKNQGFFSPSIFPKSRRAQISEGLTWVVATIVIIIILLFSIFITSFYVSSKKSIDIDSFSDFHAQKSFLSYLLTNQNQENIYSKIKADSNLNNDNGNLALQIFNGLYKDDYSQIWVGESILGEGLIGTSMNGIENEFFGRRPSSVVSGAMGSVAVKDTYYSALFLKNDTEQKFVEAAFAKKG